jgi:cytoskeletal protein RodZ
MGAPRGRRSLLRRLLGAQGAALTPDRGPDPTRVFASAAVAIGLLVGVLWLAPGALADDTTPPPTTPTGTTPDAPPPDPYHPPVTAKPKSSAPKRSAPAVVHSAPTVRTRSYSPPVTAAAPVRTAPTHRVAKKKVTVHKSRAHVVRRQVAPKPVKVTFAPFANLVASTDVGLSADSGGKRDRYLRLAGLAFALLAVAGLSLQLLATRFFQVEGGVR